MTGFSLPNPPNCLVQFGASLCIYSPPSPHSSPESSGFVANPSHITPSTPSPTPTSPFPPSLTSPQPSPPSSSSSSSPRPSRFEPNPFYIPKDLLTRPSNSPSLRECEICRKEFRHTNRLIRHIIHYHSKRVACGEHCSRWFENNYSRARHIENLETITCKECGKEFKGWRG